MNSCKNCNEETLNFTACTSCGKENPLDLSIGDTVSWGACIHYQEGKDAFQEGKFTVTTETSLKEVVESLESNDFGYYDWRSNSISISVNGVSLY